MIDLDALRALDGAPTPSATPAPKRRIDWRRIEATIVSHTLTWGWLASFVILAAIIAWGQS